MKFWWRRRRRTVVPRTCEVCGGGVALSWVSVDGGVWAVSAAGHLDPMDDAAPGHVAWVTPVFVEARGLRLGRRESVS